MPELCIDYLVTGGRLDLVLTVEREDRGGWGAPERGARSFLGKTLHLTEPPHYPNQRRLWKVARSIVQDDGIHRFFYEGSNKKLQEILDYCQNKDIQLCGQTE